MRDLNHSVGAIRGKTWIFWAQVIVIGGLCGVALVAGPLFMTGVIKPANKQSGLGPGIAMTIVGAALAPFVALAVFNLVARSHPILQCFKEGLEIRVIGQSSLASSLPVPRLVRAAWPIVTGQGFRTKVYRILWRDIDGAIVRGAPMAQELLIVYRTAGSADSQSKERRTFRFRDAAFAQPISTVESIIASYVSDATKRAQLPVWSISAGS